MILVISVMAMIGDNLSKCYRIGFLEPFHVVDDYRAFGEVEYGILQCHPVSL